MVESSRSCCSAPMTHKAWTAVVVMRGGVGSETAAGVGLWLWLGVVVVAAGLVQVAAAAEGETVATTANKDSGSSGHRQAAALRPNKINLQRLSEAHFEFSINLFRQKALLQESGNIVISPHAANIGLALIFLGSSSNTNTSTQLRTSLHYSNLSYVEVHHAYRQTINTLTEPYYQSHNFTTATRIFLQKGVGIKSKYLRAVREFYHSEVEEIDFGASGSGHIKEEVNRWAEETSNGEFSQLLKEDPSGQTRLLIGSYTRMLPQWLYPFDPSKTSYNGLFFLPGGKRLKVAMMTGQLEIPVGYSEKLTSRLLELPLLERRMSLFVILPDQVDPGIAGIEAIITTDLIKQLMGTLKTEIVNVRLPRFRIEETSELLPTIQALGVSQVLNPAYADLENMVEKNILHLSSFKHRAEIEVEEGGVRGKAAINTTSIGVLKQKYFEVDHPFLYFIWDYFTGTILLIGRVQTPIVL